MKSAFATLLFCAAAVPVMTTRFSAAEDGTDHSLFNGVAIKVNDQNVSVRDVEAQYYDSYVLIQDKLRRGELSAANLDQAIRIAWTDAIDTSIQDKLIDQRAEKRKKEIINFYLQRAGQAIGPDKAIEMFRRLVAEYVRKLRHDMIAASGGEEELLKALKRRGQTVQEWEANLEKELFRRDILAMELGAISVRPSEVREYYQKHPDQFGQVETWRLRRIRIAKSKFNDPETALEAAKLTKKTIEKGKEFAEVAAKISDDPQYASSGGLMTRNFQTDLPPGAFPAEERVAEGLKDGGISDPIDAGNWYVLIQRAGHLDAATKKFEEVSDKAEAMVYSDKLKQKKKEMYERLKRESYIEVFQKDPPDQLLKKE